MFDGLKGMASLAGMMKDLPKMQAQMAEVKSHLNEMKFHAASGPVRVVVNGGMQVEAIEIDESTEASLEPGRLQDLVRDAINEALQEARDGVKEKLSSVASEMGLPLPPGGLDL